MSDPLDINALLSQAMEMQSQLMDAQAEAAEAEVTGRAGGGVVEITVTGSMQFVDVSISPDAIDPDDVTMVEDLVLAALNDAMTQIDALQRSSLGGLDLGAIGGIGGLTGLGGAGEAGEAAGLPGLPGLPGFGGALDATATDSTATDATPSGGPDDAP